MLHICLICFPAITFCLTDHVTHDLCASALNKLANILLHDEVIFHVSCGRGGQLAPRQTLCYPAIVMIISDQIYIPIYDVTADLISTLNRTSQDQLGRVNCVT